MTSCSEISVRLIDQLGVPPQIIPQLYVCPVQLGLDQMAGVTVEEFKVYFPCRKVQIQMWY